MVEFFHLFYSSKDNPEAEGTAGFNTYIYKGLGFVRLFLFLKSLMFNKAASKNLKSTYILLKRLFRKNSFMTDEIITFKLMMLETIDYIDLAMPECSLNHFLCMTHCL